MDKFIKSKLEVSLEKTTNDTYLKVFESNLIDIDKKIKPASQSQLMSNIKLDLNHNKFNFETGMSSYETLGGLNSDKYQYILPYYDLDIPRIKTSEYGNLSFSSSGSNNLKNTNNLSSSITNNLNFITKDFISFNGIINKFGIYFKNKTLRIQAFNENKLLFSSIYNLRNNKKNLKIKSQSKYYKY